MDIGEVIRQSGLPASTLRYYEERGLIRPLGRHGLRRVYAPEVIERLALIALGRAAGFSLDEIAEMFDPDGMPHIDRAQLRAKAEQIDHMIVRLQAMRDGLQHAADCKASSHFECPSFRRLLRAATADTRKHHRPAKNKPGASSAPKEDAEKGDA